jgi:hypothetical protein
MGSIRERMVLRQPFIQELACPSRRVEIPEVLEGFLEKISADGFQVVAEEIAEAEVLLIAEVLVTFEQQPRDFF